ncbi:hypothetical protein Btru_026436 [Bulinus truncatus]|nr:hypothetical protein Btru_026436 [Bulinus truncatus]
MVDATDHMADTRDHMMDDTDRMVDATDQMVDDTDHMVDARDRMVGATDRMVDATDRMVDATDRMVGATDRMVDATDHMVDATDRMVGATDHMMDATDHMVDGTDRMVDATDHMVDATDHMVDATDHMIMMDNTDGCQNASSYDAIMGVHSAPTNAAQREAYRWYYGDFNKTSPYKLRVFFFIGQVDNLILQNQLANESQQFGDLVQGSFLDSYRNLTYKAIFTFKWLNDHCHGMRLLLRLDDDVFLGLPHFLHAWDVRVVNKTNSILCDVLSGDIVFRGGKWPVEKSDIEEERYNFNRCLGYFSAIAPDLIPKMVEVAMKTRFFWIDDVFLYGFVAKKVGVAFVNVADKVARWKEKSVEECIRTQRDKCDFVAFLVSVKKFYYLYGLMRTDS